MLVSTVESMALTISIRHTELNSNQIFDVIENKKKALKLKEKGNDAFKRKKYEVAEKFYSEALQLNLDSRPVWTNRAVCRNTMKKHEDALADCISALSIDPKNTKKGIQSMKSRSHWQVLTDCELYDIDYMI